MNQRATDTPEQVFKFAPKEKAPNRVAQLDDAGQAIVAQIFGPLTDGAHIAQKRKPFLIR